MGAVKDVMASDPEGRIVLHVDKDGWYGWSASYWWDRNPDPDHYGREEVGRFADLLDALAARDAFNQMMHGKPNKPI
jgi:hypothetical protein